MIFDLVAKPEGLVLQCNYKPGKTAYRFHQDKSFVRELLGPVGCGKTVSLCMEVLFLAMNQQRSPRDGIRYSRFVVIRNTYTELKTTTIKTWQECFPPNIFGEVKWSPPVTHHLKFEDIDCEVLFLSTDRLIDIKKLMSLNLTGAVVNEVRFLPYFIFDVIGQRVNRYPNLEHGGATFPCIIMDTNPPPQGHWLYKMFEIEKPQGYKKFHYPGAVIQRDGEWQLNPEGENFNNLNDPHKYYIEQQIPGKSREYIRVYLQGQYGTVTSGEPVYSEYNDDYHSATNTLFNAALPLGLGWDFGNTPAVAITQLLPTGRMIILREVCALTYANSMGIARFVEDYVLPTLNKYYPTWKDNYISVCDPAGNTPAQTDEKTCIQILREHGILTRPARSNFFTPRREAVAFFLSRFAGNKPGLCIDKVNAPTLHSGFLGAYHFKVMKVADETAYKPEPEKNAASHPHDGLQYIALEYQQDFLAGIDNTAADLTTTTC